MKNMCIDESDLSFPFLEKLYFKKRKSFKFVTIYAIMHIVFTQKNSKRKRDRSKPNLLESQEVWIFRSQMDP